MTRYLLVVLLLLLPDCHLEGIRRGAHNAQWLIDKLTEPEHVCCASQVNGACSVCCAVCPPYPWSEPKKESEQ